MTVNDRQEFVTIHGVNGHVAFHFVTMGRVNLQTIRKKTNRINSFIQWLTRHFIKSV